MARLILSCGMFSALAARIALRNRGLPSGSPPPAFAATVISLIRRVKILPRLASSAPFLCLMVAHFEWPDIAVPRLLSSTKRELEWRRFSDLWIRPRRKSQDQPRRKYVQANQDYSTGQGAAGVPLI